jgi:sugar transferase (PEP-CTERM/EpsH1 system associated)
MNRKILYLCHRIPYPPNKGDKIRSFNEVRFLSQTCTIDLIAFADQPEDLQYAAELRKYCRRVKIFPLSKRAAKLKGIISLISGRSISQGYFYSGNFQNVFNRWTGSEHYDSVICFSSPMAEYIFRSKKKFNDIAGTLVMDFCDLDSDKWSQYSAATSFPLTLVYKKESERLLDFEIKINNVFHKSVFVSEKEAELFKKYYSEAKNIQIIPNGVDYEFFDPEKVVISQSFPSPMLVFSGAMDYYANVDGVLWFADKILPEIRKKIADVKFYIVGSNPDPKLMALEKDNSITVTGFVKDIREYYKAADVCVIPLRIARGVQNKVLEAMSMKKAIVSTTQAVQGIRGDVKGILAIEDDPVKFAMNTVELLNDKMKKKKLAIAARSFVIQNYDWNKNLRELCKL